MYRYETKVRYSECDSNRQISFDGLMNLLQDTVSFQSEELGVGVDFLKASKKAWIINSYDIVVNRYPVFLQELVIETWPFDFKGFYGHRNFCIKDSKGDVMAYASSIWVFIDTENGRPCKVPEELMKKYELESPYPMDYGVRKLAAIATEDREQQEPFLVPPYFIDTNKHVNHEKYVLLAQQYLKPDFIIKRMRAEYRKSALEGDLIFPLVKLGKNQTTVSLNDETGKAFAIVEFYNQSLPET